MSSAVSGIELRFMAVIFRLSLKEVMTHDSHITKAETRKKPERAVVRVSGITA